MQLELVTTIIALALSTVACGGAPESRVGTRGTQRAKGASQERLVVQSSETKRRSVESKRDDGETEQHPETVEGTTIGKGDPCPVRQIVEGGPKQGLREAETGASIDELFAGAEQNEANTCAGLAQVEAEAATANEQLEALSGA